MFIPGMCHGGWCFEDLREQLTSRGHRVLTPTLTGLSERAHLLHAGVNLDTHIADVLALLEAEQVERGILVGHSYGGMLVSAAVDRAPGRVESAVYLDAFVPRDGESCWAITTEEQREWYLDVGDTGYAVPSLPFFDSRATAHPLASVLQRIRLDGGDGGPGSGDGGLGGLRRRVYVYAERWPTESPFATTFDRLRDDPAWEVHALDSAHNLMRDVPDELLTILLDVA